MSIEHFQIIDRRTGEIKKTIEASDIKRAASCIDNDAKFKEGMGRQFKKEYEYRMEWRRQFVIKLALSNCLVIDQKLGWALEYISPDALPEDAQQMRFGGKLVYYLIRNRDKATEGRLDPYKRPDEIDITPAKLWRATKIKEKVMQAFSPQRTGMQKLIMGLLVVIFFGVMLGFYLLINNKG